MSDSHVHPDDLQAVLARVERHLAAIDDLLDPLLPALDGARRRRMPRPPVRFAAAGRVVAELATDVPDLAARAGFDPAVARANLDNVERLAALRARLAAAVQRVDDARLVWTAETYGPALRLYQLAKAVARHDGRLLPLVLPMRELFDRARTRRTRPGEV